MIYDVTLVTCFYYQSLNCYTTIENKTSPPEVVLQTRYVVTFVIHYAMYYKISILFLLLIPAMSKPLFLSYTRGVLCCSQSSQPLFPASLSILNCSTIDDVLMSISTIYIAILNTYVNTFQSWHVRVVLEPISTHYPMLSIQLTNKSLMRASHRDLLQSFVGDLA